MAPNIIVESLSTPDAYQVNHTVHTGGCTELVTASLATFTAHCTLQLYVADIQSQNVLSHGCLTVSERMEQFCVH
jgi:hypothetical protein